MAEETKKSDKKKKDEKDAVAAEPSPAKASGLIPIVAAVLVLAAIGGGVGWYVAKALPPAATVKPGSEHGAATDAPGEADPHAAVDPHSKGLIDDGKELDTMDLKGNISGSGGTRYVTLTVGIWVPVKDYAVLNEASVRRLIQARLEETLKTYQLEDLGSPNIQDRMKKDFAKAVDTKLRTVRPGRPVENKFVLEVTVTSLLTQ